MGKRESKEEPDSEGKEGTNSGCVVHVSSGLKTQGKSLEFLNLIIHDFAFFEWLQNL